MKILGGVLLTVLGGFLLLYIYGFASVINPELSEAERRSELLTKMFVDAGGQTGAAILLILGGLKVIAADVRRRSKERAEFEAFRRDRPGSSGPTYY